VRKDRPRSKAAPAKDPLLDAAEVAEGEAREFFREVSGLVRYSEFADYPWERFRAYKRLAMLDLWSEAGEEEKQAKAGITPDEIPLARDSELYARLKFALTEAFREVSSPKKATDWVASMEDAAFRRLANIAKHAIDPRVASAAARDFADRALPKVSRNSDQESGAPVLMITEDGARLLMAALETVRRKAGADAVLGEGPSQLGAGGE
jgi:hypothetical protein